MFKSTTAKIIYIILAVIMAIYVYISEGYKLFDKDPSTNPDVQKTIEVSKEVYNAFKGDVVTSTTSTTETTDTKASE